jgi:hypothetical protein
MLTGRKKKKSDACQLLRLAEKTTKTEKIAKRYDTIQLEVRVCARDLALDELLDFDVVLRHEVDCVLLLADAACACALDRVRALKYEGPRFTRELGRESEDFLQF